jgi:hypothetical protein
MNRHTFKDVVKSKRSSLANDLDDDDDDGEAVVAPMKRAVEGEEEEGEQKVQYGGLPHCFSGVSYGFPSCSSTMLVRFWKRLICATSVMVASSTRT